MVSPFPMQGLHAIIMLQAYFLLMATKTCRKDIHFCFRRITNWLLFLVPRKLMKSQGFEAPANLSVKTMKGSALRHSHAKHLMLFQGDLKN